MHDVAVCKRKIISQCFTKKEKMLPITYDTPSSGRPIMILETIKMWNLVRLRISHIVQILANIP